MEPSFDHWSPSQDNSEIYYRNLRKRKTRMADNCIFCKQPVRDRQQGIQCKYIPIANLFDLS